MGIVKGIIKGVVKASIPKEKSLEKIVDAAFKDKKIKKFLGKQPIEKQKEYRALLEECVKESYYHTSNLRRFGKYVDTIDRALFPIDVVADYFKIFVGFGAAISATKELIEMPIKFLYDLYYAGKTGNVGAMVKDAIYELGSWFIPGSLLDLTNRYLRRAEKDAIKYAVKDFFEKVYKTSEKKEITKEKKKPICKGVKVVKEKELESYLEPTIA